ncbi:MAG: hypothetical protein JNL32_10910 [Candidatus Kapabacteria bacterium]|nr:hypothetical protein [Candidatus Kapabacteria bacterium]
MNSFFISALLVAFSILMAGCGDTGTTSTEQLSTNPKDYTWSGGVGTTYSYDYTTVRTDSTGRDSTTVSAEFVISILNTDTLVGGFRTTKILSTLRKDGKILSSSTAHFTANDSMFASVTDIAYQRILSNPIRINDTYYSYPAYTSVDTAVVLGINESVSTQAGTFRGVKLQNRNIQSFTHVSTDSWYSPGNGSVKSITTLRDTRAQNKTVKAVTTISLRAVSRK